MWVLTVLSVKIKNANDRVSSNSIIGVLFFDALFLYVNFPLYGVNLHQCFALGAPYLSLPAHIDEPPVAIGATDLFVDYHIIPPLQEQRNTDSRNGAWVVFYLWDKSCYLLRRRLDRSFRRQRLSSAHA